MRSRFDVLVLLCLVWLAVVSGPPAAAAASPGDAFTRTVDVVYGRTSGVALTLDVFQPVVPANGFGIIYIVSGGWVSSHDHIDPRNYAVYLSRGYTVFAVVHGSQPKFTIPEILPDINRAVRFIRSSAARWNVNPQHLGMTGTSAGAHLSLMIATRGGAGNLTAADPVERESSAVQAVACFFPPSDFLNYGTPGEDAVGVGRLAHYQPAFGAASATAESRRQLGLEISPARFLSAQVPPILIIHGDADTIVPIQQSQTFIQQAVAAGATARLVVKPGLGHGWPSLEVDRVLTADWFDRYLQRIGAPSLEKISVGSDSR